MGSFSFILIYTLVSFKRNIVPHINVDKVNYDVRQQQFKYLNVLANIVKLLIFYVFVLNSFSVRPNPLKK